MAVDYGTKEKTLKLKDRCKPDSTPKALIPNDGDVGSRFPVRFWITLVVGGARHADPVSDPKDPNPAILAPQLLWLSTVSQPG